MVDLESARNYCLKLPEVQEYDHFGKPAYAVKKKIFATLWLEEKRATLKLSPDQQDVFCLEYAALLPVKGKWGKFGWTNVDLNKIDADIFSNALTTAWLNVTPKSMSKKYNLSPPNR
jgi:hypothetical protein